jgi:hypothetical protein
MDLGAGEAGPSFSDPGGFGVGGLPEPWAVLSIGILPP